MNILVITLYTLFMIMYIHTRKKKVIEQIRPRLHVQTFSIFVVVLLFFGLFVVVVVLLFFGLFVVVVLLFFGLCFLLLLLLLFFP